MMEIAGFTVSIAPPAAGREVVLLGVVPVGAIARTGGGGWCWAVDLPLVRQMRRARSREDALRGVERTLGDWLHAARRGAEARMPRTRAAE